MTASGIGQVASTLLPDGVIYGSTPVLLADLKPLEGQWRARGQKKILLRAVGDGVMAVRVGRVHGPVYVTHHGANMYISVSLNELFDDSRQALIIPAREDDGADNSCYQPTVVRLLGKDRVWAHEIDVDRSVAANRHLTRSSRAAAQAFCGEGALFGLSPEDQQRIVVVEGREAAQIIRRVGPAPR